MSQRPQNKKEPRASSTGQLFSSKLVITLIIAGVLLGCYYLATRGDEDQKENERIAENTGNKKAVIPLAHEKTWEEIDDPAEDGWETEALAEQAKKQLMALGEILKNLPSVDEGQASKLLAGGFMCEPLRPVNLTTVIDNDHLKIERSEVVTPLPDLKSPAPKSSGSTDFEHHGAGGFLATMRTFFSPFEGTEDLLFEGKVFRIFKQENEILTRQYVSISGVNSTEKQSAGKIELHTTWDIGWSLGKNGQNPKMRWLRIVDFEQTESLQPGGALFADCTKSVLGGNPVYADQFLRGMNHWFERIQDKGSDVLRAHPGLAIGDVNGDGLDDLYVCQERGLPNRLFIQNADGTAREESARWGVDWLQSSRSALLIDLDNDKDQDLVVAILGGVAVAENDGQGKFHLREVLETENDVMSLSAVDYDMDGRLDIYACVYFENKKLGSGVSAALVSAEAGFSLHDANNGGHNVLFQNRTPAEEDWRFVDVTKDVGLDVKNHRYSLAASWDDFDNDGDLDLYVSNDYGRDHLYRNDSSGAASGKVGRRFVDISDAAHVEDSATGMSTSWADYDRDGWMDVFIANMWSSAGNRIAFQEQFKTDATPEEKQRFQRVARGNTLLRNQGDGTFADHSAQAGIEMGRWAWGTNFVDLNNDGWEDVVVASGYITTGDTGDL